MKLILGYSDSELNFGLYPVRGERVLKYHGGHGAITRANIPHHRIMAAIDESKNKTTQNHVILIN